MLKSPDFIRRIGAKTFLWIKLNRILESIEKTVFDKKFIILIVSVFGRSDQ